MKRQDEPAGGQRCEKVPFCLCDNDSSSTERKVPVRQTRGRESWCCNKCHCAEMESSDFSCKLHTSAQLAGNALGASKPRTQRAIWHHGTLIQTWTPVEPADGLSSFLASPASSFVGLPKGGKPGKVLASVMTTRTSRCTMLVFLLPRRVLLPLVFGRNTMKSKQRDVSLKPTLAVKATSSAIYAGPGL